MGNQGIGSIVYMLLQKEEFQVHLEKLKIKDTKAIKISKMRLYENTDQEFYKKAVNIFDAFKCTSTLHVANVLEEYINNTLCEFLFKRKFNKAESLSLLSDLDFIAFLIQTNLLQRVVNLNYETKGEVKLRIYCAMINYSECLKEKKI